MARLRFKGNKALGLSVEPETTAQPRATIRRRHSQRPSVPRPSIEVHISASGTDTSRQSTIQAIPPDQPSSSRGRVTRSKRTNTPLQKLPSPPSRKRHTSNAVSTNQPVKRQRSSRHKTVPETVEEEEPSRLNLENEEISEEEDDTLPKQDFLNNINSSLGINSSHKELPKLRPNDSAQPPAKRASRRILVGVTQIGDAGESTGRGNIPKEQGTRNSVRNPDEAEGAHEPPQAFEQGDRQPTQAISQSNTPSRRRSLRRKKRRQSQKPTYGEPHYNARVESPDLGSVLPPMTAIQASSSQHFHTGGDIYDVPSDEEQPSQLVVENGGEGTHIPSSKVGRKTDQSKQRSSEPEAQNDQASSQAEEEREERNGDNTGKKDGQGEEHGDEHEHDNEDFDSDGDEPTATQELDVSDPTEDSLLLDAPPNDSQTDHLIATACIKREGVQRLVYIMTLSGWMNRRKWHEKVLDQAKIAYDALEEQPSHRLRSRIILAKLYSLYKLCEEIPLSSKSLQLEYFREKTASLGDLLTTLRLNIDSFISRINVIMEQGDEEQVTEGYQRVTKLHRRIIPMLVLVLDKSFEAGCGALAEESKKASSQKGEFTVYLLQPVERAAGWIYRLSQVVESWYELHPPRTERDQQDKAIEHRRKFRVATTELKKVLEKARRDIDAMKTALEQRRKARERDEAVRREREAQAQRHREIQEVKMQQFLQSVQNIRSSSQRRPRIRTYHQAVRSSHPASSQSQLLRSQEPLEASYFEKHGWYYWEDDQLLSLIRTTSHPNYEVFHQVLPNRDPDELRDRSRYLRNVMRDKYERRGVQPPGWCIDEG
ncbi:hypothetical protein FBEOM_5187 [Fusarium beomiforme]|uniref:Uncharacterized protein n=1 Tax=Fusarium beomiforme TaxID=44412 RepID=A0A9P5ALK2_9HYPO|nr:hypothetical protein FBEOM_5187 [Fusarium beomiforme]